MLRSLFANNGIRFNTQAQRQTAVAQINPQSLQQRLQTDGDDLILIDVRTPGEYQRDGHIDGSRLLPLSSLTARVSEVPEDKTVVCVCRSGSRSHTACEMLAEQGYKNVINLSGGMIGWKRAGLPYS
jgi:rhodanese-related sulfurtransferase